jgi:VWFA-related protein
MRICSAVLLALLVVLPLHARQGPSRFRAQSVYVLALRASGDAAAYTTCQQTLRLLKRPDLFPGSDLVPAAAHWYPGGVPDPLLQADVEKRFRSQRRFVLAASAEQADLVFVVQVTTAAILNARLPAGAQRPRENSGPPPGWTSTGPVPWPVDTQPPPQIPDRWPDPFSEVGGQPAGVSIMAGLPDLPATTRTMLLAFAIPASVYRQAPDAAKALLDARLWEGWDTAPRLSNLVKAFLSGRSKVYTPLAGEHSRQGSALMSGVPRTVCLRPGPARAQEVPGEPAPDAVAAAMARAPTPSAQDKLGSSAGVVSRFKSGVMAVAVPVIVTDDKGDFVGDLNASDFRVFEDDIQQPIAQFLTASEPLNVALVMDTSQSMKTRFEEIRGAASAFVDALRPEDRISVVSFNDRTYLGSDLTRDRNEIHRAILQTRVDGVLTRLYDSLDAVLTDRLAHVAGRRALLLLTDGVDVGSGFATAQGTLALVQAENVPVYVLQYDTRHDPTLGGLKTLPRGASMLGGPITYFDKKGIYEAAASYLWNLCEKSGGRVERVATANEILEGFRQITAELRRQYVLYYYPANTAGRPSGPSRDGAFHRIRVEIDRPGVTARTRSGYR